MSADRHAPPDDDETGLIDPGEVDEAHLAGLDARFAQALEAVRRGDVDQAAERLRAVLLAEPRLAEPRIELARLLLETDQLEEAQAEAEEAVRILEAGGQWIDDLPEGVVLSLALDLLGEALRRQADRDEVVFGDPDRWRSLIEQSRAAFARAAALDPDNAHAAWWAGGTDADRLAPGEEDGPDEDEEDGPEPGDDAPWPRVPEA